MYNSQTINAKHRQDLRQASMSTWTQACKLSMPNQWARSHRLQCQPDISTQTSNTKPINKIL